MAKAKATKAKKEMWRDLNVEGISNAGHYKVSNTGLIKSFAETPKGKIIKGSTIGGYKTLCIRLENGNRSTRYVHKLVAQTYLKRKKEDATYVIHLDHDKLNNDTGNLKWATKEEVTSHQVKKPGGKKPGRKPGKKSAKKK